MGPECVPYRATRPRARNADGTARAMIGINIAKPMEPKSAIPF
jgi:hypothetical protein